MKLLIFNAPSNEMYSTTFYLQPPNNSADYSRCKTFYDVSTCNKQLNIVTLREVFFCGKHLKVEEALQDFLLLNIHPSVSGTIFLKQS